VIKKILLISGICLALAIGAVIWFFVAVYMSMERGEEHQRQLREEQRSGKWDFGDQPALFAVAQAIVKNDQDAIRVAAKALPDLQTPGRDGTTLLYFAVTQSWQRPELAEAVRTLLSLGADPNYTNGKRDSFAMANAVHASAPVLRAMLEDGSDSSGYPLLLYRTKMGLDNKLAYADALTLLERGADPNRAGADGVTFGKMLTEHRAHFGRTLKQPPAEFAALWDWAGKHGIVQQAQ
jgi:hypothetical protein